MLNANGNDGHLLSSGGSWGTASNSSLDSEGAAAGMVGSVRPAGRDVKVVLVGKAGVGKSGESVAAVCSFIVIKYQCVFVFSVLLSLSLSPHTCSSSCTIPNREVPSFIQPNTW